MTAFYLMETSNKADFNMVRQSVLGLTTDQGAERDIGKQTVRILPGYQVRFVAADPKSCLWPRALPLIGHLHISFNGLSESSQGLDISEWFSTH